MVEALFATDRRPSWPPVFFLGALGSGHASYLEPERSMDATETVTHFPSLTTPR